MNKKSFTIMEVIVAVVIIGILATLGFPGYKGMVENQKAKVCQQNLEALKRALDIYAMENDTLPGDLSELPVRYIQKAYAQILQEKGAWKIKLAYFIVDLEKRGLAFAQQEEEDSQSFLTDILAHGDIKIITCPADHTPPTKVGGQVRNRSYGMNSALKNLSSSDYRNLASGIYIIADCESPEFSGTSGLSSRHEHASLFSSDNYAQAVTKGDAIAQEAIVASPGKGQGIGGGRATAPGQTKKTEGKSSSFVKAEEKEEQVQKESQEENWWDRTWNGVRKWSCSNLKFCF